MVVADTPGVNFSPNFQSCISKEEIKHKPVQTNGKIWF